MRYQSRCHVGLARLLTLYLCASLVVPFSSSFAQVAPKAVNTRIVETTRIPHDLGTRTTQVTEPTTNVTTTAITGGTRPGGGANLFHSFDFFTVGSKDIAHFQNDMMLPTTNIIARVIGDAAGLRAASTIDGILRTNNPLNALDPFNFGSANLYLVNPAGIIFGPNAQLDIKGSFAAATADYLRMTGGALFHTDPAQPTTLSIGSVEAFGFTGPRPVAISFQDAVLFVATDQTISVIGGNIQTTFTPGSGTGSLLSAPSGQINIASVASAGEVVPNQAGQTPSLDVSSFTSLGQIVHSGSGDPSGLGISNISVSSSQGAGTVLIRGGGLSVTGAQINANNSGAGNGNSVGIDIQVADSLVASGNSQIVAFTSGAGRAGNILVNAGTVRLTDPGTIMNLPVFNTGAGGSLDITANTVEVLNGAQTGTFTRHLGRSGNVTVHTDNLTIRDGGTVFSTGFGVGQGGTVDITARDIIASAQNLASVPGCAQCSTGIAANTGFGSPGGSIRVQADTIRLLDGASISSNLFSTGPGAPIDVTARDIKISGFVSVPTASGPVTQFSGITGTLSGTFATGTGGNITVNAGNLDISNSGRVTSVLLSAAPGNAGNIKVTADTLNIHDRGGIFATSFLGAGNSGDISITAKTVSISGVKDSLDPGSVADFTGLSATTSVGRGGAIHVATDDLVVANKGAIASTTFSSGAAGSIAIQAKDVSVTDAAFIIASTGGSGAGGSIDINANRVTVSGEIQIPGALDAGVAAITAQARAGSGNAGTIKITADQIGVLNKGSIDNSTLGSGKGGSIELNATSVQIANSGEVSASSKGTGAGSAGNITIQGLQGAGTEADSLLVSGTNSLISTTTAGTGQGGNIQVATKQMQIEQLGRITADTTGKGKAGNVTLTGESLTVASGGRVEASTSAEGNGGSIAVTTIGDVTVSGVSSDGQTRSGLFAKTQSPSGAGGGTGGGGGGGGGTAAKLGNAGNITINAKNLLLDSGAQIDSSTTSGGAAAGVSITAAENITIAGSDTRLTSDATRGDGKGGSITLVAKNITVREGASVTAATGGKGDAGNVTLTALDQLLLQSAGTVTTSTSGSGKGGTIIIQANQVLLDGAGTAITADTLRPFADMTITINVLHPNDGDLVVQLDSPTGTRVALLSRVGGTGDNFTNTMFNDQATTQITFGTAPFTGTFKAREPLAQLINELVAGNWTLNVQDKATGNVGSLQNWTLQIGQQTFQSTGAPKTIPDNGTLQSTIAVANPALPTVQGTGEAPGIGGDVTVNTGTLTVQNGATMSATSRGSGKGGIVTVNASGPVALSGTGSGLFTNAEASGTGGDVNVTASRMTLDNGATVSAKSSGTGDAGTITINAGTEFLSTNGSVTTESSQASGGNITLLATDMVHLKNSQISASVQGGPLTSGGNIFIDPQFVILQNSQIIAQAVQGAGGNINIVTNTFLSDASSVVSASSQFGLSGTVNINSPVQNLSGALVPLMQSFLSGNVLLNQRCAARMSGAGTSTFIVAEREGLPQEPGEVLTSPLWEGDGSLAIGEHSEPMVVASVRPTYSSPMMGSLPLLIREQGCR